LKNIVGVIGGFVLWSGLWLGGNTVIKGMMPERYSADGFSQDATVLFSALVLSVICSVVAGWVTGRIAKDALRSGKILGVVLLVVGIMVQASFWQQMPLWYHIPFLALLFPMAKMGAARAATGSV
jgi:uncharacterized membrane protein YeaQ/YmgE (transglycosylase-associated protein family)